MYKNEFTKWCKLFMVPCLWQVLESKLPDPGPIGLNYITEKTPYYNI
jgi:hypothetical protein